jgi:3-phytase
MRNTFYLLLVAAAGCADPDVSTSTAALTDLPVIAPEVTTPPLHNYEDQPLTPDADDPAIWAPEHGAPLVIGDLKDAGLHVYDVAGELVQALLPSDPSCGRYNNVAILPRVRIASKKVDVAVVTDRGCDQLRFFAIDPAAPNGPLVEITSPSAPRVFPDTDREEQQSAYGLAVYTRGSGLRAAVTQRERNVVALLELRVTGSGRITYAKRAELVFPGAEDSQLEGLAYDADRKTLWASQEDVGLWAVSQRPEPTGTVAVSDDDLVDVVTDLGGEHLVADVEGITVVDDDSLLVSSQGDNTFHVYDLDDREHEGAFRIEGVGETDGLDVITDEVGSFEDGLLVVQNGAAPPPPSTDPVDGYEYDGSTQFVYVDWELVDDALDL